MLEKTIYSQGKNQYKDNTFCSQEWSAPIMVSPTEIEARISEMKLVGRTISSVRIMGLSLEVKERRGAGVALVTHHHGGPLAVAHCARTRVGEAVDIYLLRAELK